MWDSALVENWGPLMITSVPDGCARAPISEALLYRMSLISGQNGSAMPTWAIRPSPKKVLRPADGPVYELARDNHVQRAYVLSEASHRAHGYDPLHTQGLQGVDVGPGWYLRRHQAVSPAMPRQEGDAHSVEDARYDWRRWARRRACRSMVSFACLSGPLSGTGPYRL